MAQTTQVIVDKEEIKRAEDTWDNFVRLSKVSTYGTCAILVLLWFFLIAL